MKPLALVGLSVVPLIVGPARFDSAAARDRLSPDYLAPLAMNWKVHESGLVRTLITNWGQIGSMPGSSQPFSREPSAQWPDRSGIEHLWVGGFWFGARQNGVLRVTTAAYASELAPAAPATNVIYATRAGSVGGSRAPSPAADDDADGSLDEDWLDGYDNDGDGKVDEDFAAISDEMFASTYNDFGLRTGHVPLNIEVRQATMAWSHPEFDDFIGFELHVANPGTTALTDFHVGLFADCDVGSPLFSSAGMDDRAGFWEGTVTAMLEGDMRDVELSVAYMFDEDGDGGTAPGFIGFVFLDAPPHSGAPVRLRNFRMFAGSASYAAGGDPTTDPERFACLNGTSPFSLSAPDVVPRPAGTSLSNNDWRVLASVGPWTLEPASSFTVAMAMVFGAGLEEMLQNAAHAQILYEGVSADCDGNPQTPEECTVHWTTQRTVPVVLEHMDAWRAPDAVHVNWRLSLSAQREIQGLRLHRGESVSGPFEACASEFLAPTAMHFEDRSAPRVAAWYRLEMVFFDGTTQFSRTVPVDALPPEQTFLDLPRLGTADVTIRWNLAENMAMRLTVHDVNGRLVRTLRHGVLPFGSHTLAWDQTTDSGLPVARGIYVVRLEAGSAVHVRKVALVGR